MGGCIPLNPVLQGIRVSNVVYSFCRYALKGGDGGYFKIDQSTGDVIVSKSLDDIIVPKLFTLVVEASDKGTTPFSTEAEVKIKVVDRETPVFDKLSFSKQIPEDSAVGTQITRVTARSPNGAEVLYSVTQGDPLNQFSIDFKSGKLKLCLHDHLASP